MHSDAIVLDVIVAGKWDDADYLRNFRENAKLRVKFDISLLPQNPTSKPTIDLPVNNPKMVFDI
jgi:hypothetical protein